MPSVILATGGYDHTVRLWEAPSGICYRTLQFPDSQVNCLQITPDKQYIAAGGRNSIRFFEVNQSNPNPITSFEGHTSNITAIGFQKDGRWMYSGSEDGTIRIWDLRTSTCQREYKCDAAVNTVALHPNQGELISGDQNGVMRVWDLTADSCVQDIIPEGDTGIRSVTVGYDGRLCVMANNTGSAYVYRMQRAGESTKLTLVKKFQAHKKYILKCQFSPDAKRLATCSADFSVKMWNMSDYSLDKTLQGHQRWVWDCSFSADSAYLVTASSDHSARLWDLSRAETIRQYTGHHKPISAIALTD